ncbi:MAG TPA: GNAT family N-acetyltransferase [Actinomycetota bacterium]|nr:GNAT family N-acetyltransferase [Actinomycetota bacterium]
MIRFATPEDLPFLKWMLYEASYPEGVVQERPPFEKGLSDPTVWVYLDGWMRKGDAGLILTSQAGGPQGAAWYRLFTADAPGYGFIDEQTPELAIALVYYFRGTGLGTQLLQALMSLARKQGHKQISLHVDHGNTAAQALYEKCGFREAGKTDDGIKMLADLRAPLPWEGGTPQSTPSAAAEGDAKPGESEKTPTRRP